MNIYEVISKLEELPKTTKFFDGDGEEVQAYRCKYCETYTDKFYDGMPEEEKQFVNDEISDHMRGCTQGKCASCNGYTFIEFISLEKTIEILKEVEA